MIYRDDTGATSSHGGPTFCLGVERGGDAELGGRFGDRGMAGVGTPGATAADRSTGRTCRSRRATGSIGLERGQC
jgi:hypothetical protein